MYFAYIVERFAPCSDVSSAIKSPQEGVTEHIDSHGQRVHCGTVEC